MPNILPIEKQITAISALSEGVSIRSIERMTGIHRDTVMRLGVRVGEACGKMMDEQMRNLPCRQIQIDEVWGFVGKKQRVATSEEESAGLGDVWTFVAFDPETKAVPSFLAGKRDFAHTHRFVSDLASRMRDRVQLSTDGMNQYMAAIEEAFGENVDYGQVVKIYSSQTQEDARRYSTPYVKSIHKTAISGDPDRSMISTSLVERQNLTMRMHMRRLTRLTNAFSKKLENFKAAAALHFAYYNFVKIHSTIRCTPAMAIGVAPRIWTVKDLVELAQ